MTSEVIIIMVASVGFAVLMTVLAFALRGRAFRPSKAKRAEMNDLMTRGAKARATVTAVQATGAVVNNVNIRARVHFRLDPLDGSPSFEGMKKAFFNQPMLPRVGDVSPAWYEPTDPSTFVVAIAGPGGEAQFATYREFGLRHPLDTAG